MASSRVFLAGALLLFGLSVPASASVNTYRVGIDVDNNAASGCDFSLGLVPPGTLPGFELQVTVVVDDDPIPPVVSSAQVETCDGASFTDPQPLIGFELEFDGGLLGADSILGSIPLSLLGNGGAVRLAFHAQPAGGDEDALFTVDGTADGAPILFVVLKELNPVPLLSGLGLVLLVALLLGLAWSRSRYGFQVLATSILLAILVGAVVTYAEFGEPLAVDDPNDAIGPDPNDPNSLDPKAEIIAAFVMQTETELGLRLDIEDFPNETDCSDLVDNDFDGAPDCGDGNCLGHPCEDSDGCTLNDTCKNTVDGPVCGGTQVDCATIIGNECAVASCVNVSSNEYKCNSTVDATRAAFGSCTPEGNCAGERNPDGTCAEITDECILGRCVEQAGDPPSFVCEGTSKAGLSTAAGGCDDDNPCTTDGCTDGNCTYDDLDAVACDDGNDCTMGDTCDTGVCVANNADNTTTCDDGNACTDADHCDGFASCIGTPNDANACDDGSQCTTDACVGGTCVGTPLMDGVPCVSDLGCATDAICDGGICEILGFEDGLCVTDNNPCTEQFCTPSGCATMLMDGSMPCEVDNGTCVLGRQACEDGTAVGGCVPNVPEEPCP